MTNRDNFEVNDGEDALEEEQQQPSRKKSKAFSAKEFRKHLKGENIRDPLQRFHELCFAQKKDHDYILEYLQAGGTCLELLQLMETHTDVCHLILEITYAILLEINSKYPRYSSNAHDACRYFLSTYVTMTNKMLSMNSTRPERIAALKFLTAVVTLSPNFAKDILIHVNINATNLGFLTNVGYSGDAVRGAFINFLMSFLIDGYYPTISALLEKRGVLTSVLKGLIRDSAETLCVVINMLKSHVLENPLVSKTVKMRTFSTPVVKDIVQLYNWRGLPYLPNNSKKDDQVLVTEKLRVSDCIHEFLLILCTSHKYGVIFRDSHVGLGGRTQNSLVYTVLDSFDTPWKHSYASELVIKICSACPDLTKTVWTNLNTSLEPRRTEQWLCALQFAGKLMKEFEPGQLEYCIKELTPYQLAQVTQILVAPTQILKTLMQEETFNDKYLKYHVSKVLTHSIQALELFLTTFKTRMPTQQFLIYSNLIKEHMKRNFPNSSVLLANFKTKDDFVNDFDYIDAIFQLLSIYQRVCSELLEISNLSIDFKKILDYTKKISHKNPGVLEIKMVKLYLELDPAVFSPNTELFEQVMPFILSCYCRSQDEISYKVLETIFFNTNAFEYCESEVRIWISSLTNIDDCTDSIIDLFTNILKLMVEKSLTYFSELSDIKSNLPNIKDNLDIKELLEVLSAEKDTSEFVKPSTIRHVNLSPLILALFDYLSNVDTDKTLRSYLQYAFINLLHSQTDPNLFYHIVQRYDCSFLRTAVLRYLRLWRDADSEKMFSSNKGKLELYAKFSCALVRGDLMTFLNEYNVDFKHDILNLLNMSCFYIVNFAKDKRLDQTLLKNCLKYVKFCTTREIEVNIMKHPTFFYYFSLRHVEKENSSHSLITNFLLSVIKDTKQDDDVLARYQEKLFHSLRKIFQKPSQYKNIKTDGFMNVIKTLNLNMDQCHLLLREVNELQNEDLINKENTASVFVLIVVYLLDSLSNAGKTYEKILEKEVIMSISRNLIFLLGKKENIDIALYVKSFKTYLETFPHCLDFVLKELFIGIVLKEEYNKECVELCILLLRNKFDELFDDLFRNIDGLVSKKGVILPILDVLVDHGIIEENLKIIFDKIEPIIRKALQKPQKAGQHFERHFKAVEFIINSFFSFEECKSYVEKIHKFETIELFHVSILKTIFKKAIIADNKYVKNSTLIYIHLTMNFFKKKLKTEEDWSKFRSIINVIIDFCHIVPEDTDMLYSQILENETVKTFCKFCLKFGLSGRSYLLSILSILAKKFRFSFEESKLLIEMIVSHSQFLDWVLGEDSECKTEILKLMRELFKGCEKLMSRQYLPILLASYRATLGKCDRIIFDILKMFEASPTQTNFYDFNPFLWGKSAANHYSIKSDVQKALWRQPRTGSVLDILEMQRVLSTINKHPLDLRLDSTNIESSIRIGDPNSIYDLTFLIPLFALLLAPENAIQTYRFTKSGALALTITALCSEEEDIRNGACFVLSRFYHHVQARQSGKDNQLWLRFVEAICKGMATTEDDLRLNKFASVFLSRMSLILTQPMNIMYIPLSQYLSAKSTLDFNMIPELYTLLHSSDVNFKEHRNFMLEVLRDGLVSAKDFHIALRSVSFKLIMEQYTSMVTDLEAKWLILQVIERATALSEGTKFLCTNYGLLSWLYNAIIDVNKSYKKHVLIFFNITHNILICKEKIDLFLIMLLTNSIIDDIANYNLTADMLLMFLKNICLVYQISSDWLTENRLRIILNVVDCKESAYILKYRGRHVIFDVNNFSLGEQDVNYYVKFLTLSWLRKQL